uniref:Uncharacterized protein n=1 Tax=Malacoplasma iowae 695 TaxID=1048830 RepID=A0A6P1LD53_MALIO
MLPNATSFNILLFFIKISPYFCLDKVYKKKKKNKGVCKFLINFHKFAKKNKKRMLFQHSSHFVFS